MLSDLHTSLPRSECCCHTHFLLRVCSGQRVKIPGPWSQVLVNSLRQGTSFGKYSKMAVTRFRVELEVHTYCERSLHLSRQPSPQCFVLRHMQTHVRFLIVEHMSIEGQDERHEFPNGVRVCIGLQVFKHFQNSSQILTYM